MIQSEKVPGHAQFFLVPSPPYSGERVRVRGHAASCAASKTAPHPSPLPRVRGRGSKTENLAIRGRARLHGVTDLMAYVLSIWMRFPNTTCRRLQQ
jgi:hypothetical protein